MVKKLLALILVLAGIAGGGALGLWLRPVPEAVATGPEAAETEAPPVAPEAAAPTEGGGDYVPLSRQIVVPVVEGAETRALMMFRLALDVAPEGREAVYASEPRLRDAFLRDLMALSHTGAFLETYTDDRILQAMRARLLATARHHLGVEIHDVLILDMLRQER